MEPFLGWGAVQIAGSAHSYLRAGEIALYKILCAMKKAEPKGSASLSAD